ncbi:MAG: DEAD/DEAH box helicase family protein [Legionella sp.]|nr:DEAD/DEAH box helicase family protein [Legionella sp.]
MLSPENRNKIVQSAKSIYWAYLRLEFASQKIQSGELSLQAQINAAIVNHTNQQGHILGTLDLRVTIGGKEFRVELKPLLDSESKDPELKSYDVSFLDSPFIPLPTKITNLKAYSKLQKQKILTKSSFQARRHPSTGVYHLESTITHNNKSVPIGGPDKISLYASHIANLGIFIEKLQKPGKHGAAMLAALATGSGKSFTQALWILVLHMADLKGLFAVPKNLVSQLKTDVGRLLPDVVTQNISTEEIKGPYELKRDLADEEDSEDKPFKIISYETVFSNEFKPKMDYVYTPDKTLLSFDEQHLTNAHENWTVKLRNYVKRYTAIILSATPKENTYELSGKRTTVSMSRKEKEKQGYAIPSENIEKVAPDFNNKIMASNEYWFTRKFYKLLSTFANALVNEISSPVDEMIKQSQFSFVARPKLSKDQELGHYLRWNIAVPSSEKMLIVTHDQDTLINLMRGLEDKDTAQAIYKDGTLVERTCIYDLFQINNIEETITQEYNMNRRLAFENNLKKHLKKVGYKQISPKDEPILRKMTDESSMRDKARHVVFTNVINNTLSLITGYDTIALDQMRFEDLDALYKEVNSKLNSFTKTEAEVSHGFINEGLDESTAQKLSADVFKVMNYLRGYASSVNKKSVVDNWIVEASENINNVFSTRGGFHWESYHSRFLFENLERNHEQAIRDKIVYSGFTETNSPLRIDGNFNPKNKKRQHNAIEIFNDQMNEYSYTPVPDITMTPDQLKAAFKKGLIPYWIGNTMVEGFNDPNLNVIVNLIPKTADASNQPDKIIQASGRNRCLNHHKIPIFMQIFADGVASVFSLNSLNKMDYVPDFLKGTSKYNHLILDPQGRKMAEKIKHWIYEQIDTHGCIKTEEITKYVFTLAKESLLELNKNNDHDIEKSRKQFIKVLDSLENELSQIRYKISHGYELSRFVNFMGNLLNAIGNFMYRSCKKEAFTKLTQFCNQFKKDNEESESQGEHKVTLQKMQLYQKIVSKDFSVIQKNGMVFSMLGDMLKDQAIKIQVEAEANPTILIDSNICGQSVKKNLIDAFAAAFRTEGFQEKIPFKCFKDTINAKDNNELFNELVSLHNKEEKNNSPMQVPISYEKTLELLEQNAELGNLFKQLKPMDKAIVSRCLLDKVKSNSIENDIKAYLNISLCQHYKTFKALIHNPIFLRLIEQTLTGFSDKELELMLPTNEGSPEYEKLERIHNIKLMVDALKKWRSDDFDDKFIKYLRTMENSKRILEDISTIFKIQFDSHLYFHQINKKGVMDPHCKLPLLFQNSNLDGQHVLRNESSFNGKATQIFFLKAIKDSLPDLNSINDVIQLEQKEQLANVSRNLVAPLRSTINKNWELCMFKKPNAMQIEAKKFGKQINEALPLNDETAQSQENCLSGIILG